MMEGPGRRSVTGFRITTLALLHTAQLRKHASAQARKCSRSAAHADLLTLSTSSCSC